MRLGASLLLALAAGCFSPQYKNGDLRCSAVGSCPSGYHCAADGTCWRNGQDPTLDLGPGGPDDLAALVYPPAAVWISSGGGSAMGASGAQINLSFGGTPAAGVTSATSGALLGLGYINTDNE
jgi:hypothetical protein